MKSKRKVLIYSAIAVIVIALIILPKIGSSEKVSPGKGNRGSEQSVISVSAHITKTETLKNNVFTTGTILANEEVELKSEISGKIVGILFKEGSNVNKGDLLVKINDEELKAQLERAKYRLKLLEDREYRQKVLLEREAISQEDYDVSLNELNMARSEIDLVQAQLNKTQIQAPFSGRIGLKSVSEGSFVNSNTTIATLQNINPVKIDFSIPEKYSQSVQQGDQVIFTVTGSDEKFTGQIYAIEPKIDPVTRTLRIRAIFQNSAGKIFPGSFADIQLVLKEIKNTILIPTEAVVPELKGQKVFVYRNGVALPQNINIGVRSEENVQVVDGLIAGDTVITSGILQIRPGVNVKIARYK